jgi:hypothetical protein
VIRGVGPALVLCCSRALLAAEPALAQAPVPPPPPASDRATQSEFRPEFVLESARKLPPEPDPELVRVRVHGEYQVRFAKLTDLPLSTAGDAGDALGQTERLYHWLRITPRLQLRETLEAVAQLDLPEGLIVGQEPRGVRTGSSPFDERMPVLVEPRWLYVDLSLPFGRLRAGQAPFHFGLGMLENDGDHPPLFGDYERGAKFERLEFLSGDKRSRTRLLLAGDVVYEDERARLVDGDLALRGTLGFEFESPERGKVALIGSARHQRARDPNVDLSENVIVLDSSGTFNAKIPGASGFVFGGYEAAYAVGDSRFVRALSGTVDDRQTELRGFGAVAHLGAVLTSGSAAARWGSLVLRLEWGYASGDDDPLDGMVQTFRFDPNYNVGLILFDEVLRWKTARSAALLPDASLAPGADPLPSGGAVFGATYLHPSLILRPLRELDVRLGAVLAQATVDVVDPARLALDGRYRNYDGGRPGARDLGLELDLGLEYRLALEGATTLELGAQGGVLFPGRAFADASGHGLGTQAQAVGRFGLQY